MDALAVGDENRSDKRQRGERSAGENETRTDKSVRATCSG